MSETGRHSQVNLRKSHPTLYHSIVTLSLMRVALALNFWTSDPTFNPWGIPKNLVGLVFFMLGAWQLIFLHVWRDLRKIRLVLALSAGVMLGWGLVNTQQSFDGKASFQLPIMYVAVAALQLMLLLEAPVNPMTEKS